MTRLLAQELLFWCSVGDDAEKLQVKALGSYLFTVYKTETFLAWQALLEGVLASPDAPIDRVSFVSKSEQDVLLRDFNDVKLAPSGAMHAEQTIYGLLEHWAEATPQATAVVFKVCNLCAAS